MAKQISLILLLIISASALFAQPKSGRRASTARLIGNVTRVADDCGCYFRAANKNSSVERYIFFEDASEGAPVMNISGRDVRLRLVSSTESPEANRRKGSRSSRRYAARDIKVLMDLVATSVCPPAYDPECAGESYDVRLTVIKGARRQTIKAVGGCGC